MSVVNAHVCGWGWVCGNVGWCGYSATAEFLSQSAPIRTKGRVYLSQVRGTQTRKMCISLFDITGSTATIHLLKMEKQQY